MGIKNALYSIVLAATLALSPAKAYAEPIKNHTTGCTPRTEPDIPDITDKVIDLMEKKNCKKETGVREYSISKAWLFGDRTFTGFRAEMSDTDRRLWFTVGVYTSDLNNIKESDYNLGDINIFLENDKIVKSVQTREMYIEPMLEYTLYDYILNPCWKMPFQIGAELRVGAGINITANIEKKVFYIQEDYPDDTNVFNAPGSSMDMKAIFSGTAILKVGPAQLRYSLGFDLDRRFNHLLGLGGRF